MTSAFLQTLLVALALLAAAVYLGRKAWRSVVGMRRAKDAPGCASDCGCGKG
jgi:hypothetical protein